MKNRQKQTRKYRGGGYVTEEKIAPGITFLEMNGKGFAAEFGKIYERELKKQTGTKQIKILRILKENK